MKLRGTAKAVDMAKQLDYTEREMEALSRGFVTIGHQIEELRFLYSRQEKAMRTNHDQMEATLSKSVKRRYTAKDHLAAADVLQTIPGEPQRQPRIRSRYLTSPRLHPCATCF